MPRRVVFSTVAAKLLMQVVSENVEELSNPLHEAARRGNLLFLKECIGNQVSVNSLDKSGSTALYWACHGGHVEVVKYLLQLPAVTISSQVIIGRSIFIGNALSLSRIMAFHN
ncbi:hypothetical protein Y032_0029g1923 [Ancylostoma ceylanicum]|uniref:Uncharacterized protein n=1 Tax=Ancylostoma ceylanicum TaxID=53326 RepID=A0A016URM5_9BILA|nr:hypothetical protein Y032_0029g1923 [Ancylostoma ceylanicum]